MSWRVELGKAKGRLKPTTMNRTEARYAELLEARRTAGEIVWWGFEALKLRLADNTFYTPDFLVIGEGGLVECHEVKGFWREDARVKIKVAAARFPFIFVAVQALPKKKGGGWAVEVF